MRHGGWRRGPNLKIGGDAVATTSLKERTEGGERDPGGSSVAETWETPPGEIQAADLGGGGGGIHTTRRFGAAWTTAGMQRAAARMAPWTARRLGVDEVARAAGVGPATPAEGSWATSVACLPLCWLIVLQVTYILETCTPRLVFLASSAVFLK